MSGIVEKVEAPGKGEAKSEEGKPIFLPTRYIHREAEALALRIESKEDAEKYNGKIGDWRVTDDMGYVRILSDEEFKRDYQEYEGVSWPGKLNLQLTGNLSAHGCKAEFLLAMAGEPTIADALNRWSEKKENYGKVISHVHYFDRSSAVIFYTTSMSDREREEAADVAVAMREAIDEKRRKALVDQEENLSDAMKEQRAEEEKKAAYQKELEELAIEGRKHRANCSKKKGKK